MEQFFAASVLGKKGCLGACDGFATMKGAVSAGDDEDPSPPDKELAEEADE